MASERSTAGGGIGFGGLLTIVLITLKLCNVITWAWWIVLSPLWFPFVVALFVLALIGLFEVLSK